MLCQSAYQPAINSIEANCLALYWDLRRFTLALTKSKVIPLMRRFSNRFAKRDDWRPNRRFHQDTLAARWPVWFDRRIGVRRRGAPV